VQLRKSKREESLQKRRQVSAEAPGDAGQPMAAAQLAPGGTIADLNELLAAVGTNDRAVQREATVKFRKLLSIGARPHHRQLTDSPAPCPANPAD